MTRHHQVVLIPGDGIGPEVTAAVRRILDAAGAPVEWVPHVAGLAAIERGLDALPAETLEAIRKHEVALKGPCTTPIGEGFVSINVRLRKELDLYAAVRPVRTTPSTGTFSPGRTRTRSPTATSATGTTTSTPSWKARAVRGVSPRRRRIACDVRPLARASSSRPRRISAMMDDTAS